MKIYLSIDNGADMLEIPVVPPEFQVSKPQGDNTFETVDGSEIAFIDPAGLKSVGWSSFFPSQDYPYIQGGRLEDVWQYGYKLDTWIAQKYPIRLVMSGTPINMAVKVAKFDYHMGRDGDIYYDIELKEFPLVDTETEELTMAQYEELKGLIDELTLKVESVSGGNRINTVEDGAPFYSETLQMLLDKGYLTGSGEQLDLTEDMARVLTVVNRAGGFHTGMIYNYYDGNIPGWAQPAINWLVNGVKLLKGDEEGRLNLTEDMMRIFVVLYDANVFGKPGGGDVTE